MTHPQEDFPRQYVADQNKSSPWVYLFNYVVHTLHIYLPFKQKDKQAQQIFCTRSAGGVACMHTFQRINCKYWSPTRRRRKGVTFVDAVFTYRFHKQISHAKEQKEAKNIIAFITTTTTKFYHILYNTLVPIISHYRAKVCVWRMSECDVNACICIFLLLRLRLDKYIRIYYEICSIFVKCNCPVFPNGTIF